MTAELDTLCYIQEQTSFPEDHNISELGYKEFKKDGRIYLIFDTILQSFNVLNRNRREYILDNIWDCIMNDEEIQHNLKTNQWYGCIDHPAPMFQGQQLTMQYISNPDMKYTSHYIRNPRKNGNFLEATIQTDSSNEYGMNFAIKIIDGKIIPCFSARVFGSMKNQNNRPIVYVRKLITYDWVRYPSHREAMAKINQPVLESAAADAFKDNANVTIIFFPELARMAANSSKETEWLCESFGLSIDDVIGVTDTGNSVVINENGNTYVQPIRDRQVRANTRKILTDWVNN